MANPVISHMAPLVLSKYDTQERIAQYNILTKITNK